MPVARREKRGKRTGKERGLRRTAGPKHGASEAAILGQKRDLPQLRLEPDGFEPSANLRGKAVFIVTPPLVNDPYWFCLSRLLLKQEVGNLVAEIFECKHRRLL
jgi:hypothetical protein